MKLIWIFNHYAQGPEIPGGTRHYDLAQELIKKGYRVTLFAAGFHYTLLRETVTYNAQGYCIEEKNGVTFIWVKTYPYQVNNWKRMVNILSYAMRLTFLIPKLNLEKPDMVIGSTVHPFAPLVAYRFAKKYDVPFVFEIRDLWPQTFIDMGVWKPTSGIAKLFKTIEAYTVKRADTIISLSPKTETYLKTEYVYDKNLYIPNGVNLDAMQEHLQITDTHPTFQTLETLKSQGKFLCLFSGAIVQSNNIDLFIETAKKLQDDRIQIVLVGQGQERKRYQALIDEASLENILFLDPVDKKMVPKLLSYADVLLLIQGNVQWGSSNKLYDYLAAKKPIITALYAQHNNLVETIQCGYAAHYEKSEVMVEKIEQLYALPLEARRIMGENAYAYVQQHHDTKILAGKLDLLYKSLVRK